MIPEKIYPHKNQNNGCTLCPLKCLAKRSQGISGQCGAGSEILLAGYETYETLKVLHGLVDIYLPDIKYANDETALKLSNAPSYFEVATRVLKMLNKSLKKQSIVK